VDPNQDDSALVPFRKQVTNYVVEHSPSKVLSTSLINANFGSGGPMPTTLTKLSTTRMIYEVVGDRGEENRPRRLRVVQRGLV
jgi:hypothetical protein